MEGVEVGPVEGVFDGSEEGKRLGALVISVGKVIRYALTLP